MKPRCDLRACTRAPDWRAQTWTVVSRAPEIKPPRPWSSVESEARHCTEPKCCVRLNRQRPQRKSQTLTDVSRDAENAVKFSASRTTSLTVSEWPRSASACARRMRTSHKRTVWSAEAVITHPVHCDALDGADAARSGAEDARPSPSPIMRTHVMRPSWPSRTWSSCRVSADQMRPQQSSAPVRTRSEAAVTATAVTAAVTVLLARRGRASPSSPFGDARGTVEASTDLAPTFTGAANLEPRRACTKDPTEPRVLEAPPTASSSSAMEMSSTVPSDEADASSAADAANATTAPLCWNKTSSADGAAGGSPPRVASPSRVPSPRGP
mmetsp:Transcript_2927/g.10488  ORF Transcript_2927/g.10488 Transcript_2927/m.10488 type:complete len:325 (-) Transcript_2927:1433-2407(-)